MKKILSTLNVALATVALLILAVFIQIFPRTAVPECDDSAKQYLCSTETITEEGFPHVYRTNAWDVINDGGLAITSDTQHVYWPSPKVSVHANELRADIRFSAYLFFIPLLGLLLARQYAYSRD